MVQGASDTSRLSGNWPDLPVERFNTFIEGNGIYLYIKGMYIRSFSVHFLDANIDVFPDCTMKYMGSSELRKNVPMIST